MPHLARTVAVLCMAGAMLGVGPAPAAAVPPAAAEDQTTTRLEPVADTVVRKGKPRLNGGDRPRWVVAGRPVVPKRAYLTFQVPAPPAGEQVRHVAFSAYVEIDSAEDSTGLTVHRTSADWREDDLVWADRPALGRRLAETDPSYDAGSWVSWNLTDALTPRERTRGGVVSLVVTTHEGARIPFSSRESDHPPRLVVTTAPVVEPGDDGAPVENTAAQRLHWGRVVAGDEFDYEGEPDDERWNVYDSPGHDGNGVRAPDAWQVAGGVATVRGDAEGTTGGMSGDFDRRTYGRWEVRMRTSARDPNYHPVVILWPDEDPGTCPEIDYAEGSGDTTVVSFFLHYGCGGKQTYAKQTVDTTEWHHYAVEWTPAGIVGYVDGVEWFRDEELAHQPPGSMHQTLQLDWFPDGSPTEPSWMQVDWVRVYDPPVLATLGMELRAVPAPRG